MNGQLPTNDSPNFIDFSTFQVIRENNTIKRRLDKNDSHANDSLRHRDRVVGARRYFYDTFQYCIEDAIFTFPHVYVADYSKYHDTYAASTLI